MTPAPTPPQARRYSRLKKTVMQAGVLAIVLIGFAMLGRQCLGAVPRAADQHRSRSGSR